MTGYIRKNFKAEKLETVEHAVDFAMTVLSASNEGVLVTDDGFGIVFANDAFCKIIGNTAGDLSEFDFGEWLQKLNGVSLDGWSCSDRPSGNPNHDRSFRYEIETNGNPSYFDVRVFPLEVCGSPMTVSLWRDLTSQKKYSDALKKIEAETEKADREKETFFSSMNHEVRTPMNGIIGMLELAMDGEIPRKQKEYLALARCSAETLLNMLNNFFNFSKSQAGKLAISRIAFSLDAVMESIISSMRIGIREKGLNLFHCVDPDVPDLLRGDPDRLRQVLANIIGNAIKFTEKGDISVTVKNEGGPSDPEDDIFLRFSIKDTGIGIPESKHDMIFESFVQADDLIGRSYGGAGLGLSISKQIVQLMGGGIRMESEVGKGSVFHFTARFGSVAKDAGVETGADHDDKPDARKEKRAQILLVEDDRDLRHIFREILQSEGYGVRDAPDGHIALELFDNHVFEAILMDIGLPGLDGFEVSKMIREKNADIPIIALTGTDRHEKEVKMAGINVFLSKPISRKRILDTVKTEVGKYRKEKTGAMPNTELEKHGHSENRFRELGERFHIEVSRLKCALNTGQCDLVKNIAHDMKSMASDAGAQNLADEAFRLKLAARKGDMEKVAVLAEKIEKKSELFKTDHKS